MKRADLSIDQLKVGDEVKNKICVTPDLLDQFIATSGDNSRLHQDANYAKTAGFNNRVVHGALISSFFSALIGTQLPGDSALLLELSCKYHQPAFVGEEITVTARVAEIHETLGCITIRLTAHNGDVVKLTSGKALVKVRPTT
ncbi:MAG: MaoC family dehydratase N-terminal domain-containing protein [Alphaproteobacteria bacterium]|nr:MaoC family dehydratase N-terminal domain-containing protein [Alphaproteobacteria bacterium]